MKQPRQHGWRLGMSGVIGLFIGLLAGLFSATVALPAYTHGGGTPRLTDEPVGPYRLYAFTDPEPWRVGQTHVSLVVTKPDPNAGSDPMELPVTDVVITVTYTPLLNNSVDGSVAPIVVEALPQDFLGTFYFEAAPNLTREGDWQINVEVAGPDGGGSQQFPMKTLPAHTLNWPLIAGAGVAFIVIIALIALWSRSQQPTQPAHRPHRGVRRVQRRSGRPAEGKEA